MEKDYLLKLSDSLSATLSYIAKSAILSVAPTSVRDACKAVSEIPGLSHLSTITGVDDGDAICVYYHFWKGSEFVTVKTRAPKDNPHLDSISDILPSAILYEAEVKDLLGVTFDGNQFMSQKLLLPDSYPSGAPPPLRKEASPETLRKLMGLE